MTGPQLVNLALPKTGTTTLTDALRHAGLRVADWRIRPGQTARAEINRQHLGKVIYEDYFDSGDPLARLSDFDVINEMSAVRADRSLWPQTDWGVLRAIRAHHPELKFILTQRDPAATAKSMMRWNNLGSQRLPRADIPGLPRGFGRTEADLARWVEAHYAFCHRVFAQDASFMAYDIEDPKAPDKIGAFLDLDLPWWGQSNAGAAATQPS